MIGILLITLGTLFVEGATSIGKYEVEKRRESIFTMGFLNVFFGTVFFLALGLYHGNLIIATASVPTFLIRMVLEIFQTTVTVFAIAKASRSTLGFLRVGTVPLLLIVDAFMGYDIAPLQYVGIAMILATIGLLYWKKGLSRKGMIWVILSTVNAAATISLYKYNITYFNSVESEQALMHVILLVYLWVIAYFWTKENPFRFLKKKIFLAESLGVGIGSVIESFAYLYAPSSIILAAKRSATALWTMILGNVYFHEHKLAVKVVAFGFLTLGVLLLVLST